MIAAFLAMAGAALPAQAQTPQTRYATMAPASEYLIANRNAEIALARSAAPASISARAEVMVLGRHGYEVAVAGTNHFVCLVERSWNSPIGAPEFWNPKLRGPDCLNEAAAKSYLPILLMRARLALAGKSETQIGEAMQAAFRQKKLPPPEPGAMSYMLSKQGYLSDAGANWHPHLMFFVPLAMSKSWGANLKGSPVLATDDPTDGLTIFLIPVARWSDGSPDSRAGS
jgi:hypothetical protein